MKLHEFQAKELFSHYHISVPKGDVAQSVEEAVEIAHAIDAWPVVVKAQVHAGGRGKGGGIREARSSEDVDEHARALLGSRLRTPQTGPEGLHVGRLLIEEALIPEREMYLGMTLDRAAAAILLIAGAVGGKDIEEAAAASPASLHGVKINPLLGLQPFHPRTLAFSLGLGGEHLNQFCRIAGGLYRLFVEHDCTLAEINPLIMDRQGRLLALDAKVTLDDNALFRHQNLLAYHDASQEHPLETEAKSHGLAYISLGGSVGSMVNGAGLAMATMDIIKEAGAEPANFLDVGGGASAEMVEQGLRIIQKDERVRCIFVNIFGGILRCDTFARGFVQAASKAGLHRPVVIRMVGTNEEEGRKILAQSGLDLAVFTDLQEAVQRLAQVAATAGRSQP